MRLKAAAEARLLAVTITKDNRYAAPFVDLVNTFYGRPDIPIGVVHNGKTPEDSAMLKVAPLRRTEGIRKRSNSYARSELESRWRGDNRADRFQHKSGAAG